MSEGRKTHKDLGKNRDQKLSNQLGKIKNILEKDVSLPFQSLCCDIVRGCLCMLGNCCLHLNCGMQGGDYDKAFNGGGSSAGSETPGAAKRRRI